MRISSGGNRKIITATACAAALAALTAIAPPARAGYGSEFTFDLGASFNQSATTGIAAGQAVGYGSNFATGTHAYFWTSASSYVDLNPPGFGGSVANGTSGAQQVGSGSNATGQRALLWSGTAANAVDLTPVGFSSAAALNIGGGKQVGAGTVTGGNQHALLWSGTAASKVDLHPAGFVTSAAVATSSTQQVGNAVDASANAHAILWSGTAASAIDLTPPGFSTSTATGVANGQQVGYSGGHALLWSGTAASYVDLSLTGIYSQAYATNGTQQVGVAYFEDGIGPVARALVWSGTAASAVDLSSYLPASSDEHYATSIDAYGNVAGYSRNRAYNFRKAYEWLNGNLYKVGGTGAWATSSNWMSGTPQSGHDVMLLQSDATNRTITYANANSALVLGKLTIDATGSGSMVLSQARDSLKTTSELIGVVGKGVFNQSGGTHSVSGTLTIAERAGSAGSYTLSGGSLTAGAMRINANGVFNYNTVGTGRLTVTGALDLFGGQLLESNNGSRLLIAGSVSTSANGLIDLADNHLRVKGGSTYSQIAAMIAAARSGGSWTGTQGITSAVARNNLAHNTTLGILTGSQYLSTGETLFAGSAVSSSDVLVKYTYYGDTDFNGTVNLQDFNRLAANFGLIGNAMWMLGDFNYDDGVNLLDFNRLAANFGLGAAGPQVTPQDWAALAAAVPEPGVLSLAALAGTALLRRR